MITKAQRANAERIVLLADTFGHLPFNLHGQKVEPHLNLSIPTARLVVAGIVTGVADTNDGINENAVWDVERLCRDAVKFAYQQHGEGWWLEAAKEHLQGVPA
jgi:hypothetical protein